MSKNIKQALLPVVKLIEVSSLNSQQLLRWLDYTSRMHCSVMDLFLYNLIWIKLLALHNTIIWVVISIFCKGKPSCFCYGCCHGPERLVMSKRRTRPRSTLITESSWSELLVRNQWISTVNPPQYCTILERQRGVLAHVDRVATTLKKSASM